MESLNILSQTSRLSLRYLINQSVQCLLRSHRIFGVHGSGFMLISVLVAGILDEWEQHLVGAGGAGMDPSGILHLGGIWCQAGEEKQERSGGRKVMAT